MYRDTYSDEFHGGPLESLVFRQLGALINGEKVLSKRYESLNSSDPLESSLFETELMKLHQRVDRLQRMIEAMGSGLCSEPSYDPGPLAA